MMTKTHRANRQRIWPFIIALTLAVIFLVTPAGASVTNTAPLRLAIVAENGLPPMLGDLLTVEFSAAPGLALLERAEVERVYREQRLAGAGADPVQMGRLLGADGLVLLGLIREGTNQFVGARLVAVKPGVIIATTRTPWPMPDAPGWARWTADYLGLRTAKLTVKANEAIPISFVFMRSTVKSPVTENTERQINPLIIERLAREPELFVLERRRMDALQDEKFLAGTDAASFWNGSYLLEGVLDRDGYSQQNMTISARLIPPGGGAPELIELSGDRASVAALANRLAERLREILRLKSSPPSWSPGAEALRYLEQAEWALKWDLAAEARSAADSAWALGEQTLRCATTRMNAYLRDAEPDTGGYQGGGESHAYSSDSAEEQARYIDSIIRKATQAQRNGSRMVFLRQTNVVFFLVAPKCSQVSDISKAQQLLELYQNACPAIASEITSPTNSWFRLGVEVLSVATLTLKHHAIAPSADVSAPDQVAQLRDEARRTAAWLAESPAGRDTIWYRDKPMNHAEFQWEYARWSSEVTSSSWDSDVQSIQWCQLKWGQYWYERPEDFLALCRQMLKEPGTSGFARSYLRAKLTPSKKVNSSRTPDWTWLVPRLTERNAQERARVDRLWADFCSEITIGRPLPEGAVGEIAARYPTNRMQHLRGASNAWSQLGTSNRPAGAAAAAISRERWAAMRGSNALSHPISPSGPSTLEEKKAFLTSTNMPKPEFNQFFLINTEVEARELRPLLLQYKSRIKAQLALASTNTPGPARSGLESELFRVQMLEASFDARLGSNSVPAIANFAQKKALLASATGPQPRLSALLLSTNYSVAEARELQPLLGQYASKLEAVMASLKANDQLFERSRAVGELQNIAILQNRLDGQIWTADATNSVAPLVPRFIPIPLPEASFKLTDEQEFFAVTDIPNQQLQGGRLWFDLRVEQDFKQIRPTSVSGYYNIVWAKTNRALSACLDLGEMAWQFVVYPSASNSLLGWKRTSEGGIQSRAILENIGRGSGNVARSNGRLYVSGPGYMHRYDEALKKWDATAAPWQSPPILFPMGSKLYAANEDTLYELVDGSEETRILASCRRRPAISSLDMLPIYMVRILAAGPGGRPRAIVGGNRYDWNIYTWDGQDWNAMIQATHGHLLHDITLGSDATFLKVTPRGQATAIWMLPNDGTAVEVALTDSFKRNTWQPPTTAAQTASQPIWKSPPGIDIKYAAIAGSTTNLFILTTLSFEFGSSGSWDSYNTAKQNGSHVRLVYCERGQSLPTTIPLKLPPRKTSSGDNTAGWGEVGELKKTRIWITADENWVLFGQSDVQGVWALPRAEFDDAVVRQRERQSAVTPAKVKTTTAAQ